MRVFVAMGAVLLGFTLLVGGGAWWYAGERLRSQREAHEAAVAEGFARHHEAFVADQRFAEGLALFPEATGTDDAGIFFNPRLVWDWRAEALESWRATLGDEEHPLVLDDAVAEAMTGNDWLAASPEHWRGADTAWMGELARYAHWDLERTGPASQMDEGEYDWATAPLPLYLPLMHWAKLRLLQGIEDGSPVQAAAEVRHLARLAYSTENLLGAMVGLQILRSEREAFDHLVADGAVAPEGWRPLTEAEIHRLRRTIWAAVAYRSIDTPPEHRDAPLALGGCAALLESAWAALIVRPFLVDDHREAYDWLGETLEASACRLTLVRRAWAMPEEEPLASLRREACRGDPICDLQPYMWIPGVRRYIGEALRRIAGPDWFTHYED
jgi:hypothetical protein